MPERSPSMQTFTIPDDGGITPLALGVDHGICVRCEGRPVFFEVRRPADADARRLCFQCLFEEIATAQPATRDVIESEEQRLAEAEATASPEELGRMTEFLEEWWDAQKEPPPAFVTEFIARHRASAPPPATPVFGERVAEGELRAALLALLVMRGAICERHEVAADRYLVEPDTSTVSRERAAELLARMPKPLDCHARADGEIMRIRCRTITEPSHLRGREENAEYWAEQGGHFPRLREAHGERYAELPIFCLGCDESLVLSAGDVDRWHRDYDVHPVGTSASPPGAYLVRDPAGARAAAAAGAAYLMKCFFGPKAASADEEGRIIELRDTVTWDQPIVYELALGLGSVCERCGERAATWSETNTRTTPWSERRLCEVCTAAELAPHALEEAEGFERGVAKLSAKGRRSVAENLSGALELMERWWKVLPAPPEVAAALERCRRL